MHSEVPLSRFTLTGITDSDIQYEYEEVVDGLALYQRLLEITREYWLLGEVFPFAHWSDKELTFDQLAVLNPDYMVVNASPLVHGNVVQFEMEPDDATIAIVKSGDPKNLELRELLDPVVINAVESGTNIPISSYNVTHIARKASPYDLRGTSILLRSFVPGTKVVMGDGTWKPVEEVQVGDEVFTHKNRIRKVTSTASHEEEEIIRIKVNGLVEEIRCTPDHEFLVWTARKYCECGCRKKLNSKARKKGKHFVGSGPHVTDPQWVKPELTFEWVKAEDLEEDDFLCMPVGMETSYSIPVYKKDNFDVAITPGIARLLGYWVAEGSFIGYKQQMNGIQFTFSYKELDTHVADVCSLFEREFGVTPIVHAYEKYSSCVILLSNKTIAKMFYYYCGRYSHEKRLVAEILSWPLELQEQLLTGYLRGDGSWVYGRISYTSTSRCLAEQISSILKNLGLDHVIYPAVLGEVAKYPSTIANIPKTAYGVRELGMKLSPNYIGAAELENHLEIVDAIKRFRSEGATLQETCMKLVACGIRPVKGNKWDPVTISRIEKRGEYITGARDASNRFLKGNYILHPITKIERVKYNGPVYCLNVDEDHSYLLYKGISVHNCIKPLLYQDKLIEAQMAIADRLILPLQVFKLGDPKGNDWLPDQAQIDDFANLLAQGRDDPNFALVGHTGLSVEYIGANGKVLPLLPEFDFVRDRVLAALFTNRAMMDGSGPTYANASVAFEILQLRYMSLRGLLETYVQQKIFKPIAEARGYYENLSQAELSHGIRPSKKVRRLAIPDINWLEKIRLLDDIQMKRFILQLRMKMDIPLQTVCEVFDLNYETIKKQLANEIGTIADPVWRQAISKEVAAGLTSSMGKEAPGGLAGLLGTMPGLPFGEASPGAGGPSPRDVAPEGGTTSGGPEIAGMQPETLGPGVGIEAMKRTPIGLEEVAQVVAFREALEKKHVEAMKQIEEDVNGNGKMVRRVFGVSRKDDRFTVKRRGDSFYIVDR